MLKFSALLLPCYDLAPVTDTTLGAAILAVRLTTLDRTGFHGLTGGVYKAQEHIHRGMADPRLLAIPTSWSRVADSNPNWAWLFEISPTSRYRIPLYHAL